MRCGDCRHFKNQTLVTQKLGFCIIISEGETDLVEVIGVGAFENTSGILEVSPEFGCVLFSPRDHTKEGQG